MKLSKATVAVLAGTLLLASCATVKEVGRTVGHTTGDVTKAVGHASRDAVKEVGKATKEVVEEVKDGG